MRLRIHRQRREIRTELPGPRSRELLDRGAKVFYKGLADELAPLVIDRKSGYTVTDVDGNVFFDLASASASVPLGRRPRGPDRARRRGDPAVRQRGQPRARLAGHVRPRRAARRPRPGLDRPRRHRPQRHRGGRDRDPDDAPRRPAGRSSSPSTAAITASRPRRRRSAPRSTRSAPASGRSATGFMHAPYPNPYRTPVRPAAARRQRRLDGRLHPRRAALPRRRPGADRRRRDRAGARLGRLHRPAGLVLAGADRALRGARLAALRRRGEDRDGAERDDARGRALGRRAGPDLHGQGARRRRDADRRGARLRAGARRGRRPQHRQHLVLAARARSPRRSRPSTPTSARTCSATSPRSRRSPPSDSARSPPATSGSARSATIGCFLAIEFVRDPETPRARHRAPGRRRRRRCCAAASSPTRARPR